MESTVAYIEIISYCERFKLADLFKDGSTELHKTPYITISDRYEGYKEVWDNSDFVEALLMSFKNKIETDDTREVKRDLEELGINYYEAKEILVGMYDRAIQLGMF